MNKLTAAAIKAAKAGQHLQDGGGLLLRRSPSGGRWVFRYSFSGQRRDMGIGSWLEVSLAEARRIRGDWAAKLRLGVDPISERNRIRDEETARRRRREPTFAEIAELVFEARKERLRGNGERGRWFSPLRVHVIPKVGARRITELQQNDIHAAIAPIWRTKNETAEKALQRTRIIFQEARLMGYQVDPFLCDAARHMLGHVNQETKPIAATPWQDLPALFKRLDKPYASYQALRWTILTATRSMSARGARFCEIDGDIWTVPSDRMKGGVGKVEDFRVPLSTAALKVVESCRSLRQSDWLFPSPRTGCVTQNAMANILNDLREPGRPHGFRTSFRSWVQDTDSASWEVAETALAHTIGNKVERSYARSDLLEKRRVLMEAWGRFVMGAELSNGTMISK